MQSTEGSPTTRQIKQLDKRKENWLPYTVLAISHRSRKKSTGSVALKHFSVEISPKINHLDAQTKARVCDDKVGVTQSELQHRNVLSHWELHAKTDCFETFLAKLDETFLSLFFFEKQSVSA